jgi:type I restriction enzyme R subunit
VHFAVSQYEVFMATKLAGDKTFFLPFNKGTHDGGAGNDIPEDANDYATSYLWNEVLLPDNLLKILASFVHLQIVEKEDWDGEVQKREPDFPALSPVGCGEQTDHRRHGGRHRQ